jgi:hypothetical protein
MRPGCARRLTSPASISAGYGPVCRRRIREAAAAIVLDGVKAEQHAKAVELIEAGGVVPTSRPGVFRTVGSSGDVIYVTHVKGHCSCPAGLRDRLCYHAVAVRLVAAASVRRAA